MEIDFLGLKWKDSSKMEKEMNFRDACNISGHNISLSLSPSCSPLDCPLEPLAFTEKNYRRALSVNKMVPTSDSSLRNSMTMCSFFSHTHDSLPYDLNEIPQDLLRNNGNISEEPAALAIYCSEYESLEKVMQPMFIVGNSSKRSKSPQNCASPDLNIEGHAPTVAMARKATLARFLAKRRHRLTQTRPSKFIKKSLRDTIHSSSMHIDMRCSNKSNRVIQS